MRLLLERGADPNYYKDETPLHRMVLHGELRMIRLLLQFGADPDQKNNAGETALQHARRRGNLAIIKLLEGPASLLPPKPHAPVAGRLLTLCMAANVLSGKHAHGPESSSAGAPARLSISIWVEFSVRSGLKSQF